MKYILTIFITCGMFGQVFLQNTVLTPLTVVVVNDDNEPLVGVTVTVPGEKGGAITDLNGQFTLSVKPDAVLRFQYIGFAPAEFPVYEIELGFHNRVALYDNGATMLNEVVIYGDLPRLIQQKIICGSWPNKNEVIDSIPEKLPSSKVASITNFAYYPNPTVEGIKVETDKADGTLMIFDWTGRLMRQTTINDQVTFMNMVGLPAAEYVLFYKNGEGMVPVGKVVKI
jgi:CarboxypepD_reg-like domain